MIADTLEQAGHTTMLQAWDFRPGESFRVSAMLRAPDMWGLEADDLEHDRAQLSFQVEGIKSIDRSMRQYVPSHCARHVACPMPTRAMRS
jgi:hypothetical protein